MRLFIFTVSHLVLDHSPPKTGLTWPLSSSVFQCDKRMFAAVLNWGRGLASTFKLRPAYTHTEGLKF